MPIASQAQTRTYNVVIDFLSGNETYASEVYLVEAASARNAERHALQLAENSHYDDPRIPDFGRLVREIAAIASHLPETGRYCVLGTAHLSTTTANLLDHWCSEQAKDRPLNIASSVYGWFVPTRDVDPVTRRELPEDLLTVMCFARVRGFDHVLFDCDAGTIEDLPVHDW